VNGLAQRYGGASAQPVTGGWAVNGNEARTVFETVTVEPGFKILLSVLEADSEAAFVHLQKVITHAIEVFKLPAQFVHVERIVTEALHFDASTFNFCGTVPETNQMENRDMTTRPQGLLPFTEMVLDEIESTGFAIPQIEAHDESDPEEPDLIWGELTPHLELSDGEYLRIDCEAGEYCSALGMRGCSGGDPTFGGYSFLAPTKENAKLVAAEFIKYFTRKG